MKIAITAQEPRIDSTIDPRLGRCAYFLIVDLENDQLENLENPNIDLASGAGIQTARFLAEKGVQAVLTGNCGPNAYKSLTAAGIEVITGISGPIRQAVEQYKNQTFTPASGPNVDALNGTQTNSRSNPPAPTPEKISENPLGVERPLGGGGGRGMGGGGGRGMGGGGGGRGGGCGRGNVRGGNRGTGGRKGN